MIHFKILGLIIPLPALKDQRRESLKATQQGFLFFVKGGRSYKHEILTAHRACVFSIPFYHLNSDLCDKLDISDTTLIPNH